MSTRQNCNNINSQEHLFHLKCCVRDIIKEHKFCISLSKLMVFLLRTNSYIKHSYPQRKILRQRNYILVNTRYQRLPIRPTPRSRIIRWRCRVLNWSWRGMRFERSYRSMMLTEMAASPSKADASHEHYGPCDVLLQSTLWCMVLPLLMKMAMAASMKMRWRNSLIIAWSFKPHKEPEGPEGPEPF